MPRPSLIALLFWLAFGATALVLLAAAADVWLGRSDAAGRGLAGAWAVVILPFPVLGLLLFFLGRPTPLVFTAMNTNARPNLRVVVEAGARLDVLDGNGRTPLARAIVWRMWEEALLMVERGAPVATGQAGPASLEATLAATVPPETGTPGRAEWERLLAELAGRGSTPPFTSPGAASPPSASTSR